MIENQLFNEKLPKKNYKKVAFFSSLLPSEFAIIFGENFLVYQDWICHYFTTDHPISKNFHQYFSNSFHYLAFPELNKKSPYSFIIYFLSRDKDCYLFSNMIKKYPGIVFFETLEINSYILQALTLQHNLQQYYREMVLFYGQKGYEIAKLLIREGGMKHIFSIMSLYRTISDYSTAIIVASPFQKKELQLLYPKKSIFSIIPTAKQKIFVKQSVNEELQSEVEKITGITKRILCIVNDEEEANNPIENLYDSCPQIPNISLIYRKFYLSIGKLNNEKRNNNYLKKVVKDFNETLSSTDLVISDSFEYSFFEFVLLRNAIKMGCTIICSATSILGYFDSKFVLVYFPGDEEKQIYNIINTVFTNSMVELYLKNNSKSLFQKIASNKIKHRFYNFLNSFFIAQQKQQKFIKTKKILKTNKINSPSPILEMNSSLKSQAIRREPLSKFSEINKTISRIIGFKSH